MTREEEISNAIDDFLNKEDLTCLSCSAYSFKKGAEWADKHSKCPWISVTEDLPCNHENLIEIIYQSDHFQLKGTKYVFVKYKSGHYGIEHMIKTSDWKWYSRNSDIVYWMPIPEPPKE